MTHNQSVSHSIGAVYGVRYTTDRCRNALTHYTTWFDFNTCACARAVDSILPNTVEYPTRVELKTYGWCGVWFGPVDMCTYKLVRKCLRFISRNLFCFRARLKLDLWSTNIQRKSCRRGPRTDVRCVVTSLGNVGWRVVKSDHNICMQTNMSADKSTTKLHHN